MAHKKNRTPKKGDRVAADEHNGAFVISSVNNEDRTVELKQIGRDFALSLVPWRALAFLKERT